MKRATLALVVVALSVLGTGVAAQTGRKFRQEWYQGQAEDVFEALSTGATRSVPYGTFTNVLRTWETNALEPGVRDNKYYARGIGSINELTVRGGNERLVLVDILR